MPFRFEAARSRSTIDFGSKLRREHAHLNFVSRQFSSGAEDAARQDRTKEIHMITKQFVLAGCTAVLLSVATAHAGPCNTDGKSAQYAGAGPTPGHTGQTIGSTGSATAEHPPTNTMNRATGDEWRRHPKMLKNRCNGSLRQHSKAKALNHQRK
jgi:hypothetical protein